MHVAHCVYCRCVIAPGVVLSRVFMNCAKARTGAGYALYGCVSALHCTPSFIQQPPFGCFIPSHRTPCSTASKQMLVCPGYTIQKEIKESMSARHARSKLRTSTCHPLDPPIWRADATHLPRPPRTQCDMQGRWNECTTVRPSAAYRRRFSQPNPETISASCLPVTAASCIPHPSAPTACPAVLLTAPACQVKSVIKRKQGPVQAWPCAVVGKVPSLSSGTCTWPKQPTVVVHGSAPAHYPTDAAWLPTP